MHTYGSTLPLIVHPVHHSIRPVLYPPSSRCPLFSLSSSPLNPSQTSPGAAYAMRKSNVQERGKGKKKLSYKSLPFPQTFCALFFCSTVYPPANGQRPSSLYRSRPAAANETPLMSGNAKKTKNPKTPHKLGGATYTSCPKLYRFKSCSGTGKSAVRATHSSPGNCPVHTVPTAEPAKSQQQKRKWKKRKRKERNAQTEIQTLTLVSGKA